jgi:hypothetical protein
MPGKLAEALASIAMGLQEKIELPLLPILHWRAGLHDFKRVTLSELHALAEPFRQPITSCGGKGLSGWETLPCSIQSEPW